MNPGDPSPAAGRVPGVQRSGRAVEGTAPLSLDGDARTRQAAGMAENRYAVPLDEFLAGAQVARGDQVEVQAEPVVPTPAHGAPLPYGDGMSGDVDGDGD